MLHLNRPYRMIQKLSIAIAVAVSLAACASAAKRVEQGQELQRAGRPAEAAERYIQALKKDQKLDSARVGLRTAGAAAIDGYLRAAADPMANPYAAADAYVAIDDLARRSLEVGIYLVVPNDYNTRRRAAFDNAIATVVADARQLAVQRQFADALNRLTRAGTAYQPTSAQSNAIGNAGADVALAWARADTTDGHFRSAFERVDPIPAIPGVSRAQTDEARAIQTAALARGTRRVAIVPPSATVAARLQLPDDALPSLSDALRENPWASPPRFVDLVPPDLVERELRGPGGRRTLSASEAARLGRTLGADYVVISEIDSVRRVESGVRVTRRPARTTRGVDTAYVIEEGTARLDAHATFVLIDQSGQRWTDYQPVTASASGSFTRVRFAGDYRTLDLPQAERDLFARGANDELARSFVGAMSPRLADAIFAEVGRRIP
jgi:tetratricopeptide (TPR) repeat protein